MYAGGVLKSLAATMALSAAFLAGCSSTATPPSAGQAPAAQPGAGAATQPGAAAASAPFPTQGTPKYGGVLAMAQGDDPPNFDLYSNTTGSMQGITWAAYNNLVMFDPYEESKVIPDLAEKWEVSPDGKEVTFFVRKGVKFHDGSPMTMEDVRWSFETIRNPPKGVQSNRQGALKPVDAIELVGDNGIRFKLSRPYAAFLPTMAQGYMVVYSKNFIEKNGGIDIMKKTMMGTGAFKLKNYTPGTVTELEKNPDYWQQGVPYLDGVKRYIIPDANTRVAAFRTGELNLFGLTREQIPEFQKSLGDKISVRSGVAIGWNPLYINASTKPLSDLKVRQAMSLAIDREEYLKVIQFGGGRVGGYVPPTSPFALPPEELAKIPGYGKDKAAEREQAKKLLAEAGYPDGVDITFSVRRGSENIGVFLQDQLKHVGIRTTFGKVLDSGQAYDAALKKDYQIITIAAQLGIDDPDAVYPELYLCDAPRNYSGICDPKIQELFDKQSVILDPEQRKQAVWELEKYALTQTLAIMPGWRDFNDATWSYVKGWRMHATSYNSSHYKQVWFDK